MSDVHVYLSRRNLEILLAKLDGKDSLCCIIKCDTNHPKYPQTHDVIHVHAIENLVYYTDRKPGQMREDSN